MASTVNQSAFTRFPPATGLSSVLLSNNSSPLASRLFEPDTGYPKGLTAGVALKDNDSGRFNLVTGITVARATTAVAENQLERIQSLVSDVRKQAVKLEDPTLNEDQRKYEREVLRVTLQRIDREIRDARYGEFNLLDASENRGLNLNLSSGAVTNISNQPRPAAAGRDTSFDFSADDVRFEKVDLRTAFDELSQLEGLTPFGGDSLGDGGGSLDVVARFQEQVDQARTSLNSYQQTLKQTALQHITITNDTDPNAVTSGEEARQLASRLAQQLSQESFNITANPTARYFSLFT